MYIKNYNIVFNVYCYANLGKYLCLIKCFFEYIYVFLYLFYAYKEVVGENKFERGYLIYRNDNP
jgi:hypothetical protein